MKTIIILIYFIPVFYYIVTFGPNIIKDKFRGLSAFEGLIKISLSFIWPIWFLIAYCWYIYDKNKKNL